MILINAYSISLFGFRAFYTVWSVICLFRQGGYISNPPSAYPSLPIILMGYVSDADTSNYAFSVAE